LLSILFGLGAALGWGAGDFTGGIASRKVGAHRAVFYSEIAGVFLLLAMQAVVREAFPTFQNWLFAMFAGAVGTLGLMLLYHSMTLGLMSVSAPVSGLLAALLPVIVGMAREGLPQTPTVIGFIFALAAVWLISQSEAGFRDILAHLSDLKLPMLAGLTFGLYFILMHESTSDGGRVLPMIASRAGGSIMIASYMLFSRASLRVSDKSAWFVLLLNGVFDVGGNVFFVLAGQAGRLDVASVLSSLFSGVTVLLAWIFLRERLSRGQWLGVAFALAAIVLMTL